MAEPADGVRLKHRLVALAFPRHLEHQRSQPLAARAVRAAQHQLGARRIEHALQPLEIFVIEDGFMPLWGHLTPHLNKLIWKIAPTTRCNQIISENF
mgnify:CR=1 FL=1